MKVFDPRLADLAKLHDTRLAVSFGDHAGGDFVLVSDELLLRQDSGCIVLPDGLSALDGSDDRLYAPTNLSLINTTSFMMLAGVTVPDTSQKGAIIKIGDASSGIGLGIGSGDFDTAGNELIGVLEGVAYEDPNATIGTGFHTVAGLFRYEGWPSKIYLSVDGVSAGGGSTNYPFYNPSSDIYIGGYTGSGGYNRHASIKIHFVMVAVNRDQSQTAAMDDLALAAADLYPAGTYVPWDRRRLISLPASSGSSADLSAGGGSAATGTATPSVAYALAAIGVSASGGSAGPGVAVNLEAAGITTTGGSASPSLSVTLQASGLVQSAGLAGIDAAVLVQAAGAAISSGNAGLATAALVAAAGSAESSGNAGLAALISTAAAGGATAGGIAALLAAVSAQATGGADTGGSGTLSGGTAESLSAAGGSATSGSGTLNISVTVQASGGSAAGGAASQVATVLLTAAGLVQAVGQGALVLHIDLAAFGAVHSGGAAVAQIANGNYPLARLPSYLCVTETPVFLFVEDIPRFLCVTGADTFQVMH